MEAVLIVVYVALVVLMIASMWKVFVKAGQAGWKCIIPIYNTYLLLIIAGKPGWWLILLLIPFVNIVIAVIMYLALAEQFGKGAGFGIGLWLLPIIFFPILGFGDAKYGGVAAAVPSAPPASSEQTPPPAAPGGTS